MKIDEQVAAIEKETERLLGEIRRRLTVNRGGRTESVFHQLKTKQFEDLGKIFERRGGPFTQEFLKTKTKINETRNAEERQELERLKPIIDLIHKSQLDIHMKAFILRKLPLILSQS